MSATSSRPPALGAPVPDTHAHLDMLDDPVAALESAARAGVGFIATVVDVTEEPERTFEGLDGWLAAARARPEEVRIIVGCHPHNAKDFSAEAETLLRALVRDRRVAAVGETGLDFHYDNSPRDMQRAAFRTHLAIAHETGLPAVVHLREAHDEGIATLEEFGVPEAGCVIHCFTGDAELARRFVEMGCYVSFAGPVTFKKADALRHAAAAVPPDRLLVETDCPFLAPEPYRGRVNEPALVTFTAAALARAHGADETAFAERLSANALRVFGRGGMR